MDVKAVLMAARGDRPVDLLVTGVRVVDVFSGEVVQTDIAVHQGIIAGLGDYEAKRRLCLDGCFAAPGFIDAHVHIESAMLDVPAFIQAVLPSGTTTVVADPHEIANVMGVRGLRYMLAAAERQPMDVYYTLPSCVPATDMETSGARLSSAELRPFMQHERVVGLAEMMNYPAAINGEAEVLHKIQTAKQANKPVDGHAPGVVGKPLAAYIAAGMSSDHECTTAAEALEKLQAGMKIMIREGTGAKNLSDLVAVVNRRTAPRMMWCTDDRHPQDLMDEGHIDALVRRAIASGVEPVTAIRMATLSPAEHFGLNHKGAIAPGRAADMVFFKDLAEPVIETVIAKGALIVEQGKILGSFKTRPAPALSTSINVNLRRLDIGVAAASDRMRIIDLVEDQILTQEGIDRPRIQDGKAVSDPQRDILKLAVIERHHGSGNLGIGFVRGFKLKKGALAASIAHDAHNMIAVGAADDDMVAALTEVERMGGGLVAVADKAPLASLPLPIAGLMSTDPLPLVRKGLDQVIAAARHLGSPLRDPFMTLSFLALPVIPELKLTDRGLIDGRRFCFVPLFIAENRRRP